MIKFTMVKNTLIKTAVFRKKYIGSTYAESDAIKLIILQPSNYLLY